MTCAVQGPLAAPAVEKQAAPLLPQKQRVASPETVQGPGLAALPGWVGREAVGRRHAERLVVRIREALAAVGAVRVRSERAVVGGAAAAGHRVAADRLRARDERRPCPCRRYPMPPMPLPPVPTPPVPLPPPPNRPCRRRPCRRTARAAPPRRAARAATSAARQLIGMMLAEAVTADAVRDRDRERGRADRACR